MSLFARLAFAWEPEALRRSHVVEIFDLGQIDDGMVEVAWVRGDRAAREFRKAWLGFRQPSTPPHIHALQAFADLRRRECALVRRCLRCSQPHLEVATDRLLAWVQRTHFGRPWPDRPLLHCSHLTAWVAQALGVPEVVYAAGGRFCSAECACAHQVELAIARDGRTGVGR